MDDSEFLAARLDEEERWWSTEHGGRDGSKERALREIAAKRAVLAMWSDPDAARNPTAYGYVSGVDDEEVGRSVAIDEVVHVLAAVYSNHPAYRDVRTP